MDNKIAYCLAIICGLVFSNSFSATQCIALIVFPMVCTLATRPGIAAVVIFYAVAASPIIGVVASYTGSIPLSILPYLAIVVLNAGALSIAIWQMKIPAFISIPLALLVVSLPPLGSLNPVTVLPLAGWVFPGYGFLGIVLLLVGVAMVCSIRLHRKAGYLLLMTMAVPLSHSIAAPSMAPTHDPLVDKIAAIDIARPYDAKLNNDMMRVAYRFEELDLVKESKSNISVLPESVFGVWRKTDGEVLKTASGTVYGGAREFIDEFKYRNVIVNGKTGEAVYEQQNPPLVIGNPNPVAVPGQGKIKETGLSFLICYELINSWLVYKAYRQGDGPVVWVSNLSWYKSAYLKRRMGSLHIAWSRLYSKYPHAAVMSNA